MKDICKKQKPKSFKKKQKNVLTGSLDLPTFRSVNGCATNCAKRAKMLFALSQGLEPWPFANWGYRQLGCRCHHLTGEYTNPYTMRES